MSNYLAISPDRCVCPACEGGLLSCDACQGGDSECGRCGGAGEAKAGQCNLCGGTCEISLALSRLYEADRYVRRQSPDWSGDNRDHDGITAYSMAEWFRRRGGGLPPSEGEGPRPLLDPRAAAGFFEEGGEQRVIITASEGDITFTGLSWGYGGEGPNGLAAVLADAGFFPNLAEARAWIADQSIVRPWELQR